MSRRRRGGPEGPDGLVVVDKAAGWTSHDVVAKARGLLGTRRVGHGGTLDPDATGVLVLGVGRVTRLLRFLSALGKSYEGEIVLGVETDTLDASGTVVATGDVTAVTADSVAEAAAGLTGEIHQIPPMVSAVQVGGRRLHELAREGVEVERKARPVTVSRFDLSPVAPGDTTRWRALVDCSSGTYVRSLAADLGAALGTGAHLAALRRTAVGPFSLHEAIPVEALDPDALQTPAAAMRGYPSVTVDEITADQVRHGQVLANSVIATDEPGEHWAVFDRAGTLLAVYQRHQPGTSKPAVVLAG